MGVPSVIQQTSNFIDVNIYYKKQLNYNTSILTMAGTFLYIYIYIYIYKYSFYVWGCKQQARNADEWRKRWDLTVDDDSLSLLTRCRHVALVHKLLWLTVGWSKLANCTIRLERSSSSIEHKLLWSRWQQNTAGPIKKAEFVDKHSSPQ